MAVIIRDYRIEERARFLPAIDCFKQKVQELLNQYNDWKRISRGVTSLTQPNIISNFYHELLHGLDQAQREMRVVYSEADRAEDKLFRDIGCETNQVLDQTMRINSLKELIRHDPCCFDSLNFKQDLLKAEFTTFEHDYEFAYEMYSKDGLWKSLLGKDADDISTAEYYALAKILTTLDASDLEDFINLCCIKTGEEKNGVYSYYCFAEPCTYWEIDRKKLAELQTAMTNISGDNYIATMNGYLEAESGEPRSAVMRGRQAFLQNAAILEAMSPLGRITGDAEGAVHIEKMGKDYIIQYKTTHTIDSFMPNPMNRGSMVPCKQSVNNCPEKITVTYPALGDDNINIATSWLETKFQVKYGDEARNEAYITLLADTISGYTRGKMLSKAGPTNTLVSLALGALKIDTQFDQNQAFAEFTINQINKSDILAQFEMYGTFVVYSDVEIKPFFDVNPGYKTAAIITAFNTNTSEEFIKLRSEWLDYQNSHDMKTMPINFSDMYNLDRLAAFKNFLEICNNELKSQLFGNPSEFLVNSEVAP